MLNEGFYYSCCREWERSLKRHVLCDDDVALMRAYLDEKSAVDHITDVRVRKLGVVLIGWKRFIVKPWREIALVDVLAGIGNLKRGEAVKFKRDGTMYRGGTLSHASQYDYVSILKPFLLWLRDSGVISISESDIRRKVKPPRRDDPSEKVKPKDLLTFDEVGRIIDAALTIRDRALLSVLYESGARIGELGRSVWSDVVFDEYGAGFYITDTKTGKRRYSRLTMSQAALSSLKDRVRDAGDGSFVFVGEDERPMTYIGMRRVLERAVRKAGVCKKVRPHLFRKSRITHMVQQNYQESTIKKSMWNNLNSRMFQTYVSLGEADIDAEFLRKAGVKVEEREDKAAALRPVTCGGCHFINAPGARYCNKCGVALSGDSLVGQAGMVDMLKELFKDPEFRREIMSELQNG